MESLYYLTSIVKSSKNFVNVKDLKLSSYYLPICYNLKETPKVSIKKILNCINFIEIVGEPMLKLIIMLNSLKEYSIMHNATSWLGFEDGTHPEVSKETIKDLIASLNNIFSSFLNFYAVSTFFVKYYDKLDIQDKTTLFFIFKDEMDNIHPTLQENLKNSLKTNEISKNLQFDYFSINKVNSLSLKMLENMSREKVFIIKYILSLLSNTQINLQIYKKLHEIIENKSLWSQLSFNDTLNYLLISTYFHSSALYPNFLVDSFFSEIHFTDKLEDLNKNPKNSLFYYKS